MPFAFQANSEAVLRDRKPKPLIKEESALAGGAPSKRGRRAKLSELLKSAYGVVDTGYPDLGSDPKHMRGFGRAKGDGRRSPER